MSEPCDPGIPNETSRLPGTPPTLTEEDLLSVAAHELRTPLATLLGLLELLQPVPGESGEKAMDRQMEDTLLCSCLRQANRLKNLIDELMDFTRARQEMVLRCEEIDLVEVVQEAVEQVSFLAPPGMTIHLTASEPVRGSWDSERLERVVTNLLSNALKYGRSQDVEVGVELDRSRELARLSVRDRGFGVPLEMRDRIFNRFFRGEASQHVAGLGLGLFVARQITEAHGGKIYVEGEPGCGSTFVVELPLVSKSEMSRNEL